MVLSYPICGFNVPSLQWSRNSHTMTKIWRDRGFIMALGSYPFFGMRDGIQLCLSHPGVSFHRWDWGRKYGDVCQKLGLGLKCWSLRKMSSRPNCCCGLNARDVLISKKVKRVVKEWESEEVWRQPKWGLIRRPLLKFRETLFVRITKSQFTTTMLL